MTIIMMHLKRRKNGYFYIVFPGDKRVSLKTKSVDEAQRLFKKTKKEWLAGKLRDITGESNVTLKEYIDEFRKWSQVNQGGAHSRANLLALEKLRKTAGEKIRLSSLSLKHIDGIKTECRQRGLKTTSLNNYVRHCRAAISKAVDWGYLKANPFAKAKEEPREKKPPLYLTADEIPRLLAKTRDVDKRRLVVAYLYSGRRRSELVNLKWKHVDLEKEEYYVERSKAHLSKWYPMHPYFRETLRSILRSIPNNNQVYVFGWRHPDTVSHLVKEVLRNAGYGHLHLHQLRHTFATLLVSEGIDLATIGELLGHTDRRATEIYAHVTDKRARDAIRKLKGGPVDLKGEK